MVASNNVAQENTSDGTHEEPSGHEPSVAASNQNPVIRELIIEEEHQEPEPEPEPEPEVIVIQLPPLPERPSTLFTTNNESSSFEVSQEPTIIQQPPPVIIIKEAPPEEQNLHNWDRYGTGCPPFPPCTYRFLPDFFAFLFGCYGYAVGKFPWLFLIIGLLTGIGASLGLMRITLSTNSDDLVNQFMEEGSRYFSDDDVVAKWKNTTEQLNALSNSAYANKPAGNSAGKSKRKKRQAVDEGVCDWWAHHGDWRFEAVIIVAKNETLVNEEVMEEAFKLVYYIRELLQCDFDDTTDQATRVYCCDAWDLLRMKSEIFPDDDGTGSPPPELMTNFLSTVTYPADKRFRLSETIFTNSLGGVKRRDENNGYNARITAIKAMQFQYLMPLTYATIGLEDKLTASLKKIRSQYKYFDIYWETHMQTQDEFMRKIVFQELPKVAITFICVIIWCIIGALHTDALNSKPWHGLLGIASTAFACAAGFGARFWTSDDEFQTFLIAVPLMALAIGLDDMFILMNGWHNTPCSMAREERAKRTLEESGTSIFVTVMMTILDFVVGSNTPFPAIQTYSNFALWVLAFDFWLQMTIFVPILVMSDSCEKGRKQACCCCCKVKRRTYPKITKWANCNVMCCSFGRVIDEAEIRRKKKEAIEKKKREAAWAAEPKEELLYMNLDIKVPVKPPPSKEPEKQRQNEEDENEFSTGKRIIYLYVAPVLLHPIVRVLIAIVAVLFLAGSVAIIFSYVDVGFHPAHLANRKSNTYEFKIADWKYFRDFTDALQLQVLIEIETWPFDRNFSRIRDKVLQVVNKIENFDSYIWGSRLNRVPFRDVVFKSERNNMTLEDAIQYLADRTDDVVMKPRIMDHRGYEERVVTLNTFQIKDVSQLKRGAELARRLKELQSGYEREDGFRMYITDMIQVLRVFDQIVNLPNQFVYFTLTTVASTVVTAFVMIPNPICMFWMALASLAITIGTVAGMALWEVSLDPVSLVYILMAVGATADYICHCIYTFTVIDAHVKPDEARNITWATIRYRKARHLLGEVLSETGPACIGTTISIVVLSTSNNYVLESFFKVFFVSVIVGIFFMVVVIPPILCQFGPVSKMCCEKEIVDEEKTKDEESYEESEPPSIKASKASLDVNDEISVHLYENSYQALLRERRLALRNRMMAWRDDKLSNGGDHRCMVIEDDYEEMMKIRLMRRFLRESRALASLAGVEVDQSSESRQNSSMTNNYQIPAPIYHRHHHEPTAAMLMRNPHEETREGIIIPPRQTNVDNGDLHYANVGVATNNSYSMIGDIETENNARPEGGGVVRRSYLLANPIAQQTTSNRNTVTSSNFPSRGVSFTAETTQQQSRLQNIIRIL